MPPPFIAASTRAATGPPKFSSHVIGESEGASLHLKLLDELVPKDLLEVIGKPFEIGLLVGQLRCEQGLWIRQRGQSPN